MKVIEKLFSCDNWNIGISENRDEINLSQLNFKWFNLNNAEYIADPFLVELDNLAYVFYEKLSLINSKGELWCSIYNEKLELLDNKKLIGFNELMCHLSFPFIFEFEGQKYCIPETHERHEVVLFKAVEFPFVWKKEKTLIKSGSFVDTIFYQQSDLNCWLINSDLDNKRHFFKAASLFHEWEEVFPVCSYSSVHQRMAGSPLCVNGDLYFVTQECGDGFYGNSLIISEVNELSEKFYKEQTQKQILPFDSNYSKGIHTLNKTNKYIVIDSKKRKYSIFMPLIKLIYKFKVSARLNRLKQGY